MKEIHNTKNNAKNKIHITQKMVFVDLDGTILFNDTIFVILKHHFFSLGLFNIIKNALKGSAKFKDFISSHSVTKHNIHSLDPSTLSYNNHLLNALTAYKSKHQDSTFILATGANYRVANIISDFLLYKNEQKKEQKKEKLFDKVLASNANINLIKYNKLKAIKIVTNEIPFTYIGNSYSDIPIWIESTNPIAVNYKWHLKLYITIFVKKLYKKIQFIK